MRGCEMKRIEKLMALLLVCCFSVAFATAATDEQDKKGDLMKVQMLINAGVNKKQMFISEAAAGLSNSQK